MQGALATAANFCLISWAVEKKGPTYPSMFNPISVAFVSIIEALFLGQDMNVGRYICDVISGSIYSSLFLHFRHRRLTLINVYIWSVAC